VFLARNYCELPDLVCQGLIPGVKLSLQTNMHARGYACPGVIQSPDDCANWIKNRLPSDARTAGKWLMDSIVRGPG
jgi:hypothetical protein